MVQSQIVPDQMAQMNVENLLAREHPDLDPRLREMLDEFPKFREEILPSKYWQELNKKNLKQISDSSYENFKRTVARELFHVHRDTLEPADAIPDAFAAAGPGYPDILQRIFRAAP